MRKLLTVLGMAAMAAACGDGTGLGNQRSVSLSVTTGSGAAPQFSRMGALDDTIVSGTDSLIITRVQLVLREIELKRVEYDDCDSLGLGDDDGCEEFEVGPMLLDLPLNGAIETAVTIAVDSGTYDEIEFDIHKPEDDGGEDAAFLAANPTFKDVSVRVVGTFNGTAFVYESDLNVEQEIELASPLIVTGSGTATNVTLRVALDVWFRDAAGRLVDPASANKGGVNENLVKDNIKNSFEAFEDQNRDGDDRDES